MARLPRPDFAGIPRHVVQRGNNRLPCFLDDEDRQRYLQCLLDVLSRFRCRLLACVLMDNHAHLLMTPDEAGSVPRLMHTFARNYAGLFIRRLFDEPLPVSLVAEIRQYLQQQKALGSDRFRAWVETRTGRFATARPPGRPPQRSKCP